MTTPGRVPSLPTGVGPNAEPGFLYSPTVGQHAGHVVELVSRDGRSHTNCDCQGKQAAHRANLVRCLDCLDSWAYRP